MDQAFQVCLHESDRLIHQADILVMDTEPSMIYYAYCLQSITWSSWTARGRIKETKWCTGDTRRSSLSGGSICYQFERGNADFLFRFSLCPVMSNDFFIQQQYLCPNKIFAQNSSFIVVVRLHPKTYDWFLLNSQTKCVSYKIDTEAHSWCEKLLSSHFVKFTLFRLTLSA